MQNTIEIQKESEFGPCGYCLATFLFILYFNVIGLYGLKFAVGAVICWFTGGILWFLRLLFLKSEDEEGVDKPFPWYLFLLFPLFLPLAMPLWLIPAILVVSYLISVSAFGGYGKHIFNPIIVAVVFMLYGYGSNGILNASRPLQTDKSGYKIWTSGIPPRIDIREVFSEVEPSDLIPSSFKGLVPSVPGSSFGAIIFTASLFFSLVFKRRIIWWLCSVFSILAFSLLLPQPEAFSISPFGSLFLGIMPSLILAGIADFLTIPKSAGGQIVSAVFFGFFAVLMLFHSSDILAPAYGLLLSQVASPLFLDATGIKDE